MKVLHVKNKMEPRQEKYAALGDTMGWVTTCVQNAPLIGVFDVIHLHCAPDGLAVKWLDYILAHRQLQPVGVVIDVDDDMVMLARCGELEPIRTGEIEVCQQILRNCGAPIIVPTEAYLHLWPGATVIRNFPTQQQLARGLAEPLARRFQQTLYIGSTHPSPRHHRHVANWPIKPDVMVEHGFSLEECVRFATMFSRAAIPFAKNEVTDTLEPHKLYEYLAAGCNVLHAGLAQVGKVIAEFAGGKPIPSFESQAAALAAVYERALDARLGLKFQM